MKRCITLTFILAVSTFLYAQYRLNSRIVLPVLEPKDGKFIQQLDSILFIKHPCLEPSEKVRKNYTYFVWIKETSSAKYNINIVYAKPSEVENDINTGVYIMNGITFIIRENNSVPLFAMTDDKETFKYTKELMKKNDYELREMISPEEFCIWGLSYSEHKLSIEDLEWVKDADKYRRKHY